MNAFSNFHILRLGGTSVSDAGLALLTELRFIEELELQDTNISDVGLKHLERLRDLVRLDVRGTNVTADGIELFLRACPGCNVQSDVLIR